MNYTVFGNPVAHSKSPRIHQLFAEQQGIELNYTRTLADNNAEAFFQAAAEFFQAGGKGANITLPFKMLAYEWASHLSEQARAAGAVNTFVLQDDGSILGDNTDGVGLVRDLSERLKFNLSGKRILILGAGGAARGIVLPLLQQQPESIVIANRSPEKAKDLAQRFGVQAATFEMLQNGFDLVINATSSSVVGDLPAVSPIIFSGCHLAYDLFYAAQPTAFILWAMANGAAHSADGLGMLVGQAAAAYQAWHGFAPDMAAVIEILQQEICA